MVFFFVLLIVAPPMAHCPTTSKLGGSCMPAELCLQRPCKGVWYPCKGLQRGLVSLQRGLVSGIPEKGSGIPAVILNLIMGVKIMSRLDFNQGLVYFLLPVELEGSGITVTQNQMPAVFLT